MIFNKKIGLILCLQLFVFQLYAQWPANITVVTNETNVKTTIEGKLEDGKVVDLAWGHHSANNCFPESAKDNFRGKHVLYTTYLPAHAKITIVLKPVSDTTKMSLYAYMVGANNFSSIVPSVHSCIICKSDYPALPVTNPPKNNKQNNKTPNAKNEKPKPQPQPEVVVKNVGNTRVIELKGSGNQAYNVMFGVAGVGVDGLTGAYTIEVLVR
jgi:hypothetical protein